MILATFHCGQTRSFFYGRLLTPHPLPIGIRMLHNFSHILMMEWMQISLPNIIFWIGHIFEKCPTKKSEKFLEIKVLGFLGVSSTTQLLKITLVKIGLLYIKYLFCMHIIFPLETVNGWRTLEVWQSPAFTRIIECLYYAKSGQNLGIILTLHIIHTVWLNQ